MSIYLYGQRLSLLGLMVHVALCNAKVPSSWLFLVGRECRLGVIDEKEHSVAVDRANNNKGAVNVSVHGKVHAASFRQRRLLCCFNQQEKASAG